MKSLKAVFRMIAVISFLLMATAASANTDAKICKGKTQLEYIGQVLFVTEPIHELKIDQNSDQGMLKLESDEGDGFVMKLSVREKKLDIIQDPTFGPMKKSLDCSKGLSQSTCGEYISRALTQVKQARLHLASDRHSEGSKQEALECAEQTLTTAQAEISE